MCKAIDGAIVVSQLRLGRKSGGRSGQWQRPCDVRLEAGDAAAVIAASAPYRAEAFGACRSCIESLKQDVPIFKRETSADGKQWIELRS